MPYERESKQLMPAGLDLRMPSGVGEGSLVLKNWKPTALGSLRSRVGHEVLESFIGSAHTLWLAEGSDRYVGADNRLYKNNVQIYSGLTGIPLRLTKLNGYVWIADPAGAKKEAGGVVTDWWPAPPVTPPSGVPGAAGVLSGSDLRYFVTFANADGHESNPSPISAAVTVTNQEVDLTLPAGPADWPIRKVYRIGGGLEQAFQVASVSSGTTHSDNYPNDAAIRDNLVLEEDHDAPPAGGKGALVYGARMIIWDDHRLYWSPVDRPYYIPASNSVPIGDEGEAILTVRAKGNEVRVYLNRSLWTAYGDLDSLAGLIERKVDNVGIVGPHAVAEDGAIDYIHSRDGVYRYDGNQAAKVSGPLDPIFDGESQIVGVGSGDLAPKVSLANLFYLSMGIRFKELWVSYPVDSVGDLTPDYTVKLDLATGRWSQDDRGVRLFNWEGGDRSFTGVILNSVVALDSGDTDAGDPINLNYLSRYWDQGFPDNPKHYAELVLEDVYTAGQPLTVTVIFNRGATTLPLGTINTSTPTVVRFPIGDEGTVADNIAIEINGDSTAEVIIGKMTIAYQVLPRRSKSAFTRVIDLGSPHVKEAVEIEIDLDITADTQVALYCDSPIFGSVVEVETWTITGTGRRIRPRQFAAPFFGKLWKLHISSTGEFQVYGARLKVRELPAYADGSFNQSWTMPFVAPGN